MLKLYVWVEDRIQALFRRENGQDMIEYALIASVISIAVVLVTALILEPAFKAWATGVRNLICSKVPGGCSTGF